MSMRRNVDNGTVMYYMETCNNLWGNGYAYMLVVSIVCVEVTHDNS
jgi:hypothetical protein